MAGLAGLSCRPRIRENPGLWFGGDLHLGDQLPPASPFLKGLGGLGVVNLEGPIATGPGWQKGATEQQVRLRNHVKTPRWLNEHGVAAASLLNNHLQDLGPAAAAQSTAALKQSLGPARRGLLSLPGPWRAAAAYLGNDETKGLSPEDLDEISRAQARGELVVMSVHIDGPPSYLPSPKRRAQIERLSDAGAAVIAVHGSHVLGPVERRKRSLIAWGLGNLSFACPCSQESEGLILTLELDAKKHIHARVHPITTGSAERPIQAHPDPSSIFELLFALDSTPLNAQNAWVWR